MPLEEPSWWYTLDQSRARLLAPLAEVYAALSERRAGRPPRYRAVIPVICVGNFTAGGTGKTPLSLLVAEQLTARGLAPAFLTRGYGGRRNGPVWVEASIDTARDVGDEPMLLARSAPTMISSDRVAGAREIVARTPLIDAIVMDDGLLNPALAKDLRIAVVDGRRGIGNGRVIPAGPLRARLAFQLGLADAIVINQPAGGAAEAQASDGLVARLRNSFPGPVLQTRAESVGDVDWLAARSLVAFAGIVNPQRFYDLLAGLGARVVETVSFADHHAFGEDDARRLLALAARHGAGLVTTEKDHVRLIGGRGAIGELHATSRPLPIRLRLEGGDLLRLSGLLDGVSRKRPTAAPAGP